MKTFSRFIFVMQILAALLLAMAVFAQEAPAKQPAATTKQQPSTVLERRTTTKATQTQTPNPSKKPPSNRGGVYLPDRDRQRPNRDYQPVHSRMPNLIGMDISAAEKLLSVIRVIKPRRVSYKGYNPKYRPDTVVAQSPTEGAELRLGVDVVLYINPQPPVYSRMPNLIGMDGKEAGRKLSSDAPGVRLVAHRADAHISNYSVGAVVSQSPAAGTELRPGISVMIYLNPQPPVRRMPNVVGLNGRSAAETMLREIPNIPYRRKVAPNNNPNYVEGVVVSQYPAAGTEMGQGIEVVLTFNPRPTAPPAGATTPSPTAPPTVIPTLGPTALPTGAPTLVVVPDVRKRELTEAISLLRAAQLNVGAVTKKDTKETADSVLEQQPLPGQRVAVASRIDLVIGKQPETGGLITEPLKILGVIALGFFAFLLGGLWKRFRSKPGEALANFNTPNIPPDDKPPTPAPTLRFRSTMNASSSDFAASTELQTSFALRFQPKADWGQQYITQTGGPIAAER